MPKKQFENFVNLTLDDIFDPEYDKEHTGSKKKIELDGNTVHIETRDPYGFWHLSLEKGQLPEKYKGGYTTFTQALNAANEWLRNKKTAYIPSESK